MDALAAANRRHGITVLCNLHSLDLARAYCDRLVGLADGRVVFDGSAFDLTEDVAQQLYGLEAGEVMDRQPVAPRPLVEARALVA
jgi:phosphonate transport system ATP-binding protein